MKVVDNNDTTHLVKLIPRFYTNSVELYLYNEATQIETQVANSVMTIDGILQLTFDFDFNENDKYQFKLIDTEVVYRGKLIATTQTPQDYKLTTGLYEYE